MSAIKTGLVVLALSALGVSDVRDQAPRPATMVLVSVSGNDGAPATGLAKEDFTLLVDGQPVAVDRVDAPPRRLTIVFVLDVTDSMAAYNDVRSELERSIVPALRPDDRVRVGVLARQFAMTPRFSSNPRDIIQEGKKLLSVRDEERSGPSPLWDAVDTAVTALESEPGTRAVVVVSDGRATGNKIGATAMLRHAIASGVVIQALGENRPMVIPQGGDRAVSVRPASALQLMARETGGLFLPDTDVPSGADLPAPGPLIARLIEDLRAAYALDVVTTSTTNSLHKLTVSVKRPGLTVRAPAALPLSRKAAS
jgi:VWFA-related protein